MEHTPGPWRIGDMSVKTKHGGAKEFPWEVYAKKQPITVVNGPGSGATKESMYANARLIAAAPDLLEALKGMMEWARRVKQLNPGNEIGIAHNAIMKAEGRE